MHEFIDLKNEAIKCLQERILKEGIQIGDYLTEQQKEGLNYYLDEIINRIIKVKKINISYEKVEELKKDIIAEFTGYGPIEKFLNDPDINEIMINNINQSYVEKNGQLEKIDLVFDSSDEITALIEKMAIESNSLLDRSLPIIDFHLKRGNARVIAGLPPLSPNPFMCIRKISAKQVMLADLLCTDTNNQKLFYFLKCCIDAKINILISGPANVGKTKFLNSLMNEFISGDERIILIEDIEKISPKSVCHCIKLFSRHTNLNNRGTITLSDLIMLSTHLRPDRIVIGEINGKEAFDYLQILNSGYGGVLATIHAPNIEDALTRLELLSFTNASAANIKSESIKRFLKLGIGVIIHIIQNSDGTKIISQIAEFDFDNSKLVVQDIFSYPKFTGHIPSFLTLLQTKNTLPDDFFAKE